MLAIVNGRVYPVTSPPIENGVVLVDRGKIVAVGRDVSIPAGAQVIDAAGKYVLPGFVDAHTHLGVHEEGVGWEGSDGNEATDPVTPHLRAIDGFNPADQGLRDAVAGGITTVWVTPGSANVIGGLGFTVKTSGSTADAMVVKNPSGLKAAFGENPKRVYTERKTVPTTRMGVAGVLREALLKAQTYMAKQARYKDDPDKAPDRDLKLEAIAMVLRGELPLRTHAHRADDILTALRIAKEFGIKITIEHGTEGHLIAGILAAEHVPVNVGPSFSTRRKVELRERSFKTPAVLARAGVKVSLITDHPVMPIQLLPLAAGVAVREGLSEDEALRAITINPAEVCGVEDRVGSLAPGKDADVVIWDGHPFDTRARVLYTIINGEIVYQA